MLKKSVAYGWQNCDTLLSLSDRTLSLEVAFFSHSHNTPSRETFQHGSSKEILPTELTIAPDHAKYVILTLMLLLAHPPNQPQTLSHLLFSRHLSSVQNYDFFVLAEFYQHHESFH